jgi:hypothetical protein
MRRRLVHLLLHLREPRIIRIKRIFFGTRSGPFQFVRFVRFVVKKVLRHPLLLSAVSTVWVAALYGLLSLHRVSAELGHDICGPWGCGPPLQALLGWHGFCLVAASLPVGIAVTHWPKPRLWWTGIGLSSAGTIGVLAIFAVACVSASQAVSSGQPAYLIQRCLFDLATFLDVPLVPMILAGGVMMFAGRDKKPAIGVENREAAPE